MAEDQDNPFLALFESSKPVTQKQTKESGQRQFDDQLVQRINDSIEDIFCFTLNPYGLLGRTKGDSVKNSGLVLLDSIGLEVQHTQKGRTWLGIDILGQALFERLLMQPEDLKRSLISDDTAKIPRKNHAVEHLVIAYLSQAFYRAFNLENNLRNRSARAQQENDAEMIEVLKKIKVLIVQNSSTAFRETELYAGQNLLQQLQSVLEDYEQHKAIVQWLEDVVNDMVSEASSSEAEKLIADILDPIRKEIANAEFMVLSDRTVLNLQYFVKTPALASYFVQYNFPKSGAGISYHDTILGSILSKSCLPLNELGQYDFFQEPSKQPASVHNATESRIWTGLGIINEMIYELFNALFRVDSSVQKLTLKWIQSCLRANVGRGKMWTGQVMLGHTLASDGFMLNLSAVLLRFCQPLSEKLKIFKVDPTYTTDPSKGLQDETCLLASSEQKATKEVDKGFNFVTEIFFLTQKSLDLGLRVVHEKFVKLNQELGRQQQAYRDLMSSGQGSSPAAETIQSRMDTLMSKYLSLKAALLVPDVLDNALMFAATTGSWLIQIALNKSSVQLNDSEKPKELLFPLPDSSTIAPGLYFIPEFTIENICELLLLVRRFCLQKYEENGQCLHQLLDLILTFMGSPKWVQNPHLRARLAESLENLLPSHAIENVPTSGWHRQSLFNSHPHRHAIVVTLLNVFVDIEATGQSVEFEQKFGYRRPMYDVMKYLWSLPDYQQYFVQLAVYAEEHISDENAPLFLRFINLLINDAIFLLDEALNYMKQIQEQQIDRDQHWSELPAQERAQNQSQLSHIGRLARYHNIMGTETIQMLDRFTEVITQVFTHPQMVDRIASMLNYFLKNLVGPNRRNFKVKNLEEFSFRPAEIVTDICKIYLNLRDCDSFLASVSRDGRSYTPELFKQATEVLMKIGRGDLVSEILVVEEKVREKANDLQVDEELFNDAPEHFLDAIMSHLMTDPVRLPNSGQIVDRTTIARHLLSDQNDPFTRAPLTVQQLEPMDELREEIKVWMEKKRRNEI